MYLEIPSSQNVLYAYMRILWLKSMILNYYTYLLRGRGLYGPNTNS